MTLTIVDASGGPRDLGRAQGEALAEGISAALRLYEEIDPSEGRSFEQLGPYVDAAKTAVPHLVAEMEGMAEGAGVAFEGIVFLNCIEEVLEFEACTTITAGRFLMHAEQWYAGHDSIGLVTLRPVEGPPFVSPTCSGFLPAVGMNSVGFAQGIDSLPVTDGRTGIPRVLVSRAALEAVSLDAAVAAAQVPARAGGYAHVLATRNRSLIVETTARTARIVEADGAHTNHCVSGAGLPVGEGSEGSHARLARAEELLARRAPATVEAAIAILADHESFPRSICAHSEDPGGTSTVFGMVCDLVLGTMLVSAGNPCEAAWHEIAVPGWTGAEVRGVG